MKLKIKVFPIYFSCPAKIIKVAIDKIKIQE
jgi:hypothetical protein